jgi:hypothetical protein
VSLNKRVRVVTFLGVIEIGLAERKAAVRDFLA